MTPPQRTRLYFPAWRDAARANWTGTPARLLPSPTNPTQARRIHRLAAKLARAEARPVNDDHLRHAVHVIVLGANKSSRDLTNAELDLVLATFRQLAGATDPCPADPLRPRSPVVAPRPHAKAGRQLPTNRRRAQTGDPACPEKPSNSPAAAAAVHRNQSEPAVFTREFDPYATVPAGRGPLGATCTGD